MLLTIFLIYIPVLIINVCNILLLKKLFDLLKYSVSNYNICIMYYEGKQLVLTFLEPF